MISIGDTAKPYLLIGALVFSGAAGAAFSWWITSTSYKSDIATLKADHAAAREQWAVDKKAISEQAQKDTAAALARQTAAQDALATLDKKHSQDLADAKAKNDRLTADVAAGNQRVRILSANLATAERAARQHATSGSAGTASVGNETDAILSPEAGSLVLDIRGGIIEKEAQLATLQDYVENVVKGCKR